MCIEIVICQQVHLTDLFVKSLSRFQCVHQASHSNSDRHALIHKDSKFYYKAMRSHKAKEMTELYYKFS